MEKLYLKSCLLLTFYVFSLNLGYGQEASKADSIIKIQGRVYDIQTTEPVAATIIYKMVPFHNNVGIARANQETGEYYLYMMKGKDYDIEIGMEGYLTLMESVTVNDLNNDGTIVRDFELMPITVGRVMALNRLFFVQSKAEITEDSYPQLDILVRMLEEYPSMVIQLEGHTDYRGSAKLNLELSKDRVDAIKKYLVKNGIRKSRIKTKAYGGSRPITNEATEESQSRNRRVEVRILKN